MLISVKIEPGGEQIHVCPYCNYSSVSEMRMRAHVVSQHTQHPREFLCPLCQENFTEKGKLEKHLVSIHNVTAEGLQRLLLMVDQPQWPPSPAPAAAKTPTSSSAPSQPIVSAAPTPTPAPAAPSTPTTQMVSPPTATTVGEEMDNRSDFDQAEMLKALAEEGKKLY